MRPLGVVVAPPFLDDARCLSGTIEDLTVEQFVTQLRVEALAAAVLPGAAGFDEGGFRTDSYDPLPHGLGDELKAVVGTNMARHAAQDAGRLREMISFFAYRLTEMELGGATGVAYGGKSSLRTAQGKG